MDKYKTIKYKSGSIHGGINSNFNLIKFKDKIVIPLTLQIYVLNWYHVYLVDIVLDIM